MAKILIVDDVADNVKLLAADLIDDGHEVVTASDGHSALRAADAEQPDLILMDIMMPEMDGVEACRRLKANDDLATIPVIMVSGRDDDRDIIDGLDAGAVDYVTKPFRWPIVSARIRSALRTKEARGTRRVRAWCESRSPGTHAEDRRIRPNALAHMGVRCSSSERYLT